MSTLRVSNVHFDSTSTNFIDNRTTNTIRIQTTNLELNASSITVTGGPLPVNGVNVQTFNSSGTWQKPSGYSSSSRVHVQVWSAGGSGSRRTYTAAGSLGTGGCGGGYEEGWYTLSSLGATETITVGAGGVARTTGNTAGANGSFSSFGSYIVVLGGEGGPIDSTGVGRGGQVSLTGSTTDLGANNRFTIRSVSYTSIVDASSDIEGISGLGNPCGESRSPTPGYKVGGGGGIQESSGTAAHRIRARANGAASVFGGGGGGALTNLANVGIGGASTFGGRGGNASTNFVTAAQAGFAPGGGGGHSPANNASATSGAGGDGRIVITVFPA